MEQKGWDIRIEAATGPEAMAKFNDAMYVHKINIATIRRLQRAAVELLVGAHGRSVCIVCSGNDRGYLALSVSTTEKVDADSCPKWSDVHHGVAKMLPVELADTNDA